jgi:Ceramidase
MRPVVLGIAVLAMGVALLAAPPLAQDPAYHVMADQRTMLGVPNALNVFSNLPFLFVGLFGLTAVMTHEKSWTRWPYAVLFGATTLVAFGSTFYHLGPDNARLVWDRLPMAIGFAALLTAVIAERMSVRAARLLCLPFVVLSAASVLHWYWTEIHGAGDLRIYALAQFGSLLAVVLILLLYREPRGSTPYLAAAVVAYAGAKLFELGDRQIFTALHVVSGHTLKHLAAAAAVGCLAAMPRFRRSE